MTNMKEKLKKCENLIIYGTGVIARNLYNELKKSNIKVKYFVITDGHKKSEGYIDKVPVKFVSEVLNIKNDCIILVGTSPAYHLEILNNLYENGFYKIYPLTKELFNELIENNIDYIFENRQNSNKNMCMILAGYKEFVWENIFGRIKKYAISDMDICIISCGLYSDKLSEICKENGWSYFSSTRNCITLAQNKVIELHPNAKMIFKLDEDIFITENYFTSMLETYYRVEKDSYYNISFVAPLIPVNGYGHIKVLEMLNLIDYYSKKFGKVKYNANKNYSVESNPEVAKFFWGDGGFVPKIDDMSKELQNQSAKYSVCPIRFSIGAVLFSREFFEKMGGFTQNELDPGLGEDEKNLCCEGMWNAGAIIINENILVGHLAFGQQNDEMEKYYLGNLDMFNI